MLGFIKRWSKEFNNRLVTRHLYITIVCPILEYSSQVWSPCYIVHIDRIESIQKQFVRFALNHLPWDNNIIVSSYIEALNLINLKSLSKRREVADLNFLHGLLNNTTRSPSITFYISFNGVSLKLLLFSN